MELKQLGDEIDTLQQEYRVKWSTEDNYVMLIDFDYPSGWEPSESPLFFSIHDAYPRVPPLVYLPPDMTYRGSRPIHQHTRNRDDWWLWCIEKWNWRPHRDSLMRATETMRQSLAQPTKRNIVNKGSKGIVTSFF